MPQYWVYMVRCSDGSLYTGMTTDVARRVGRHNSGAGSKYTRSRRPVTLVFKERAEGRGSALRREIEIKRLSRSAKLLLCKSHTAKKGLSSR